MTLKARWQVLADSIGVTLDHLLTLTMRDVARLRNHAR